MKMNPVYRQETTAGSRSFKLPLVILIFNSILALVALLDMYSMIKSGTPDGRDPVFQLFKPVCICCIGRICDAIVPGSRHDCRKYQR